MFFYWNFSELFLIIKLKLQISGCHVSAIFITIYRYRHIAIHICFIYIYIYIIILLTWLLTVDADIDPLTKVVLVRIFHHKFTLCFHISLLLSLEISHHVQPTQSGMVCFISWEYSIHINYLELFTISYFYHEIVFVIIIKLYSFIHLFTSL